MAKRVSQKAKTLDGRKRPHRFLLATEPQRLALWRVEAERHNVSLATWLRWTADLALATPPVRAKRMAAGPSGEVGESGEQL